MAGISIPTEVRVEGAAELTRQLRRLGADIKDMREPIAELSRETAKVAASLAPQQSGALARSIHPAPSRPNLARIVADAPYAGMINYGWPERHIAPSNFLARTDALMQPRAHRVLEAAIDRLIATRGLA